MLIVRLSVGAWAWAGHCGRKSRRRQCAERSELKDSGTLKKRGKGATCSGASPHQGDEQVNIVPATVNHRQIRSTQPFHYPGLAVEGDGGDSGSKRGENQKRARKEMHPTNCQITTAALEQHVRNPTPGFFLQMPRAGCKIGWRQAPGVGLGSGGDGDLTGLRPDVGRGSFPVWTQSEWRLAQGNDCFCAVGQLLQPNNAAQMPDPNRYTISYSFGQKGRCKCII